MLEENVYEKSYSYKQVRLSFCRYLECGKTDRFNHERHEKSRKKHRTQRIEARNGEKLDSPLRRREKLRLMAKEKKARKEKRVAIDSLPRSFHGVTRIAKEFCFCDIPCFSVVELTSPLTYCNSC